MNLLEIIEDTLLDGLRLLPFLFLTYLFMEYFEHRAGEKMKLLIGRSGVWGPAWGSLLGIVPQCGFSAAASTFYAGRVVSMGTIIAVYLSTSDEMLPILISKQVGIGLIARILFIKVAAGMLVGFLVDYVYGKLYPIQVVPKHHHIEELCEHDHCKCEEGILSSAIRHSVEIMLYILGISFILNLIIDGFGAENLASKMFTTPIVGEVLAGILGLVPNCAASVALTQFYLDGIMSFGAMMSGLLVGAGVGFLVLIRTNRPLKDTLRVIGCTYIAGVVIGIMIDFVSLLL